MSEKNPLPQEEQQVDLRAKARRRKRRVRRVLRACLWTVVIAAVAVGGFLYYRQQQLKASTDGAVAYTQARVGMGTLDVTVFGSGMIQAASQPTVLAKAEGTVTALGVSVGDTVTRGQVLAVIENPDLDEDIRDLEYSLWSLDSTITAATNSGEVTTIKAPSAGRVMKLYARAGDDALAVYRQYGSVAILSTDGRMKVAFAVEAGVRLALGDEVTVTGDGFSREATITELYMQGTRATATVIDDTLPMDAPAAVHTKDGALAGEGILEINKPLAVSAFGGTVREVRVAEGDVISQKYTMFTLEDAPNSLEMESLRIQREAAAASLAAAAEKRENLIVTAPVDGVVATLSVAEGDSVSSNATLMTILEGEEMVLTIAVDELDVVRVAEGQPVTISVDALPDLAIEGTVARIAPVGTGSGGVSTYDVLLNFSAAGTGVRAGMNATGEVRVDRAEGAIYVPVEALLTIGNAQYVLVAEAAETAAMPEAAATMDAGQQAERQARMAQTQEEDGTEASSGERAQRPEGSGAGMGGMGMQRTGDGAATTITMGTTTQEGTLRAVTVGLVNDDHAQILSGLSAGEVVLYQSATGSSSNYSANMANRMTGGASTTTTQMLWGN